ncbi:MAG: hypothetical protein M0C28_41950 [Candidatus Moduliflexus flocculans]|nr:hypothetical protein [Candidatus Moduliflexus flocculans]
MILLGEIKTNVAMTFLVAALILWVDQAAGGGAAAVPPLRHRGPVRARRDDQVPDPPAHGRLLRPRDSTRRDPRSLARTGVDVAIAAADRRSWSWPRSASSRSSRTRPCSTSSSRTGPS